MTSNHQKIQIGASTLRGKFICKVITNAGLSLSLGIPLPQMAAITAIADTAQTVASVAESVASIAAESVATVAVADAGIRLGRGGGEGHGKDELEREGMN